VSLIRRVLFYVSARWFVFQSLKSIEKQLFGQKLSLEMKAKDKVCNETADISMTQEKLPYRNHKWSQCWSPSSISRVLFTLNSFHKAKQSMKLIVWKYWSCYVKLCVDKGLNSRQQLDSPPWQCYSSQGALCQTVSGPKIHYWLFVVVGIYTCEIYWNFENIRTKMLFAIQLACLLKCSSF